MPGETASKVMKCLVALIGAICLALIFLVEVNKMNWVHI